MIRHTSFILLVLITGLGLAHAQRPQTPPSGFSIRITPSDAKRDSSLPTSVNPRGEKESRVSKTKTKASTKEAKAPERQSGRLDVTTANEAEEKAGRKRRAKAKTRNSKSKKAKRKKRKKRSKKAARKNKKSRKKKHTQTSKKASPKRAKTKKKASKKKSNSKGRKRRSNDRNATVAAITPTLKGTGASFAEASPWGLLETVPIRIAAQVRNYVDGEDVDVKSHIEFEGTSAVPTARSIAALAAFADFLKMRSNILLVLIEGHGDRFGNVKQDHLLSRARASAVREFLLKKGIEPNRLVAFGVGNQFKRNSIRTDGQPGPAKQVHISYVKGTPSKRVASTRWDQFAVVDLNGVATYTHRAQKRVLQVKDQFDPTGLVTLKPKSQLTLRAPDGTTIGMRGASSIGLDAARFSNVDKMIQATLHYGEVVIRNDPSDSRRSKLSLVLGNGQTLTAGTAVIRLAKTKTQIWLAIDKGHVQIQVGRVSGLTLGEGQAYLSLNGATSVWRQLEAPSILTQTTGLPPANKTLSWKSNPNAAAYRIEFSESSKFATTVFSAMTTGSEFKLSDELPTGPLFWRVSPVDERGIPGQYSVIYTVDKDLKRPSN
ncbi:MAG: OmpA family protein [Myxococcota bacterium]|nr:OmpA family protein [Myxococcota bacterium]